MKRVTGIGGIFFKSRNPERLRAWYRDHLGIETEADAGACFEWREVDAPQHLGMTVWAPFPSDTLYFEPSEERFMVNYRVENLDALIAALEDEGIAIEGREDGEFGQFAWIMDPEGRRVELWQPPVS